MGTRNVGEEEVQSFLVRYPVFLPLHFPLDNIVFSKLPLGNQHIVDFAFARLDSQGVRWHLIEIEKPQDVLFTKSGEQTAKLSHGLRQLADWKTWFVEERDYVERKLPFTEITKEHGFCDDVNLDLIIGRRDKDMRNNLRRTGRLLGSGVNVMSFDRGVAGMVSPACEDDKPLKTCKFVGGRVEVLSEISVNVSYSINVQNGT